MRRKVLGLLGLAGLILGFVVVADRAEAAPGDPVGSFDVVSRWPGGIRVQGWAHDPDLGTSPTDVHVYVDGTGYAILTANTSRPDVHTAFGYGPNHGFDGNFAYPNSGSHTVCVYAINKSGAGSNQLLSCKAIGISQDPIGVYDAVTPTPGGFQVSGWALDGDSASPVTVQAYIGATMVGSATANTSRPDVGAANPGWGDNHGFSFAVANVTSGTHNVCVQAVNISPGANNPQLGCKNVTILVDPQGGSVSATQEYLGLRVKGWVIDPSTASAINFQVRRYTTASAFTVIGSGTANAAAPAVSSTYSGWGANHGADITISGTYTSGTIKVCVVGVNVSTGADVEVGCQAGNPPNGNIASLSLTAPSSGNEVYGTAVSLTASVTAGSVDTVEFYLDGGSTPIATDNSSPYTQTWNSTSVTDGSHTLTAKAKKAGVYVGESTAPVTLNVKNTVAVSLTGPAPGSATYGTLLLAATSDASSVSSVEFYIDGSTTPVGTDSTGPGPFEFEWNTTTGATDGYHTVVAKAKRGSTVVATSAPITVDIWGCQ